MKSATAKAEGREVPLLMSLSQEQSYSTVAHEILGRALGRLIEIVRITYI